MNYSIDWDDGDQGDEGDAEQIDFGDYVIIEQKRYGVPNEMYVHKVIGRLSSNSWVDVPVQTPARETRHEDIVPIVRCICCGVSEDEVHSYRLSDVTKSSGDWHRARMKSEATPSFPQADSQHDTNEISRLKADLEAVRSAVWDEAVEKCARKICCYCAAGHEVRFDPEYGDWIHNCPQISGEAVECDANAIRSLKHGCHERPSSDEVSVSPSALQSGEGGEAISARRFGPAYEKPCADPSTIVCAKYDCQRLNRCKMQEV